MFALTGYQPESSWKAVLLIKDYTEPTRNATKVIDVEIDERRSLEFSTHLFRFFVNESCPLGFVVGKIQASIKNGFETEERKLR